MAYYSGTAATLADLRTALLTHAVADGWVLTGDVLSKAGVYFQIQVGATNITCRGSESNAMASPAPWTVMIGKIYDNTGSYPASSIRQISFPCSYEVFGFAQELYLVVNYDVSAYQWMAFGKSAVPGLPGQGGWCGATIGGQVSTYNYNGLLEPIVLLLSSATSLEAGNDIYATSAALFWNQYPYRLDAARPFMNCFVNSNLDGDGWLPSAAYTAGNKAGDAMRELLWFQPSVWNTEATLLPIRAFKIRPSYKISLVADLAHARHLRIDNLTPGDILTLGSDKWKVFPWYIKNAAVRNGGKGVNHTGTFGWAIRYEGP